MRPARRNGIALRLGPFLWSFSRELANPFDGREQILALRALPCRLQSPSVQQAARMKKRQTVSDDLGTHCERGNMGTPKRL